MASVLTTTMTSGLLARLQKKQREIEKEIYNGLRTNRQSTPVDVCHKCREPLKIGDKLVMKIRGNRPRSRYHRKCAIKVRVI
jgi:hypothetical protein